jgi:hypothetical protein
MILHNFTQEETLMAPDNESVSPGLRWWETAGSLRATLMRLDGQVSAVVNVEKYVINPATISGKVLGKLEQIAQQMGLSETTRLSDSQVVGGFEASN